MPGSNVRILLRGENSLRQGTEPLMIVDGIPFMLNSGRLTDINSTANQSLFNTINPSDIESIEILKDASATAIYGSQGANGVIIITTKKGRPGKTKVSFNAYYGIKKVTRTMSLLNTTEYLSMRNEAFKNDGITPTASNAPDLVNWDPLKYTNWKKELIGGTANSKNLNLSISGGNSTTQFLFSGNFYSETYLFPGSVPAIRGTGRISVNHSSNDQRFKLALITSLGTDLKKQSIGDMTSLIFLPPNAPDMKDSAGNLKWSPGIENPYASALKKNNSQTYSFFGGANAIYKISNAISIKLNLGYDKIDANENAIVPIRSLRPDPTATGTAYKSTGLIQGWIVEPQLTFGKSIGKGQLDIVVGGSLQGRNQTSVSVIGSGYTNDDFLGNFSSATTLSVNNAESRYKYIAAFGRIDYNHNRKYIGTVSIRRDGSSRFGPSNRFSNFGSIGGAWIFTEEKLFRKKKGLLSFGKIKASYGTTGNDQIGDYQYLDGWASNSNYQYGTGAGFLPQKLFNPGGNRSSIIK
jgi:TonB-dependent SusC/RagA subfamily outer membrane receptor